MKKVGILAVCIALFGQLQFAQEAPASKEATAKSSVEGVSRWLDVDTLSFSARYRGVTDSFGIHTFTQGQQRSLIEGTVKLDKEARYSVHFRLSSGKYFNWAYADFAGGGVNEVLPTELGRFKMNDLMDFGMRSSVQTGSGSLASGGWAMYFRQLYGSAEPVKGFTLQYGSLGFNRGVNTEMTTYDDDGYLAGERLIVSRPKQLYFDELSATWGEVGEMLTPNFFSRADGLLHSTYHQFLARKKLNARVSFSVDYTRHMTHAMREAVAVKIPESKVVDSVLVEAYQRPTDVTIYSRYNYSSGAGYGLTVNKTVRKKVNIQAGISDIDDAYSIYANSPAASKFSFSMNGDQYAMGRRFFVRPTVKLTPYMSLFGFYTHTFNYQPPAGTVLWNTQALNGGVSLDFKNMLPKAWL